MSEQARPGAWWLVAFGAVAALGLGAFLLYRWWGQGRPSPEPPEVAPARRRQAVPVPRVAFKDVTRQANITFRHFTGNSGRKLLPETMGGGVAFLDFDNDGRQDLLLLNSCPWPGFDQPGPPPTPALYRNRGDGTFEDVTARVKLGVPMVAMGVAVGDYDNDGFVDIFISCVGRHRLFHNEGGKSFREVTREAGLAGGVGLPSVASREAFLAWKEPVPFGSSCTFLDYDGDGKLDLFVCHYVTWSPAIDLAVESSLRGGKRDFVQPRDFEGAYCRLYRNTGKGFQDVSGPAGVLVSEKEGTGPGARSRPAGKSLGVVAFDADGDGFPDVLVANDTVRNFFFHNVAGKGGQRVFKEVGLDVNVAYADEGKPRGGMGVDWGEYLPGKPAAVIANFANEPNTFLRLEAKRPLLFSDAALAVCLAGPSRVPLKFGAVFLDYDLDGRLDLLTCNGHIEPEIADIQNGQRHAQPAQLFWNTGDPERLYEPVPAEGAGALFRPLVGRGCAFADIDGDGDLDLVLAANGGAPLLLRNEYSGGNRWVRLHLKGDGVRSNRSAIGAEVTIEAGGRTMRRQITGGRGYLSQSELPLTVGLGKAGKASRVTVRWPARERHEETWKNLEAGKTHELAQGTGQGQGER